MLFQWIIGAIQKIQHGYNSFVYRVNTPTDTTPPTIVYGFIGR